MAEMTYKAAGSTRLVGSITEVDLGGISLQRKARSEDKIICRKCHGSLRPGCEGRGGECHLQSFKTTTMVLWSLWRLWSTGVIKWPERSDGSDP